MLSKSRKGAILIKIAQDKNNKVTYGALPMSGGRALPTISFDKKKPAKTVYDADSFNPEPIVASSPAGGTPKPKPASVPKPSKRLMNKNKAPKPFDMKGFFNIIDEGHKKLKGNKV